jgi:hypothetical protein
VTGETPRTRPANVPAESASAATAETSSCWECCACGLLSDDEAFGEGGACPVCGTQPSLPPRAFPPDRLRRLESRIRHYHDDGESEIVVIMVATYLETMLEDLLVRMMASQGADMNVGALVLDSQRSIGQRLGRLFPKLARITFEEAAAKKGYADFPPRWRTLRSTRNAFIHDMPFEGALQEIDADSSREAMTLLEQAHRLFVELNNEYAVRAAVRPSDG